MERKQMKVKSRIVVLVMTFMMIFTTSVFGKEISVTLNGTTTKNKAILEQGTYYLPVQFYKDYLGCEADGKSLVIERSDAVIWLSDKPGIYNAQVNYRNDATIPLVKRFNGIPYIKSTELTNALNYLIQFDNKKGTLNVEYTGPRTAQDVYLSDQQLVTISGYVYDSACKPVKDAKVELSPRRADGSLYSPKHDLEKEFGLKEYPVTYTDENGYYEFVDIDSEKIPCVSIHVEKIIDGKVYISERNGSEPFIDEILGVETVKVGALRYITKQEKLPPVYMIEKPKDW